MNEGLKSLKEAWNERPLDVISAAAYSVIALATFMNALSVLGRRRR